MYDLIEQIIDHQWVSNYTGDQQYIIYGCIALIIILVVVFVDLIRDIFCGFLR